MTATLSDYWQAHILAIDYGLLPPAKCHATGGSQVVEGKFEPDHTPLAETRCMVLAHWYDHTNILVQYNPILNYSFPYQVTGVLDPEAAGNYWVESEYNEKTSYVLEGRTFFLWWDGINSWIISDSIGWKEGPYWKRASTIITGAYAPQGGASGTATVKDAE